MASVAARDPKSLQVFYDRYSPLVFTVCLRIVKDRSEAEDLLVDIFWELWDKSDRFDAKRGSPITYLLTLARSRAIDRLRARRKDVTSDVSELSPTAPTPSPSVASVSAETARAVKSALAELEPNQREAIECAFYEGLSHSEIADKLNKPLGTVKTNIRQGLIQLRAFLRKEYRSET